MGLMIGADVIIEYKPATYEILDITYNAGGGEDSNKDAAMRPLEMTDQEKSDLVAFLESLSGEALTGPEYVWSEAYPDEYPVIEDWLNQSN